VSWSVARGGTPLAYSLQRAAEDIRDVKRPRVVVVTDGSEGFGGNPVAAAGALVKAAEGVDLAVVGFAIGYNVSRSKLKRMATAGSGTYYDAKGADSLVRSVEEALRPTVTYLILDAQDREVARGRFGDKHVLPEGAYACVFERDGRRVRLPFEVPGGGVTRLRLPD